MRLTEIHAHGFRNLSPAPVFFGAGTTLIAGENAQGKTNLLEAIALACGQRSFRKARLAEMACDGNRFRVVNFTSDRKGIELDGLDQPLHLVVLKEQMRMEFVAILSRER